MRLTLWSSNRGDVPANVVLTNNFAALVPPTVNDDSSKGYEVGSQWVNTATGTGYMLLDATKGAAVWSVDATGTAGMIVQGAPASQDTAATLTAAQLLAALITSAPAGAINLQAPLATAIDTALPKAAVNQAFDFSIINTSGGANAVTLTTNTGITLVGYMVVGQNVSGRFRARKTATGAWTIYRVS